MQSSSKCLLVSTLIIFINTFTFSQFDYNQTHRFKDLVITIKEMDRNNIDYVNNVYIEIQENNNLIQKYVNVEGDYLDSSYVMDYDGDQNPEIILISRSTGSGGYVKIYLYEYEGGNLFKINFPDIPTELANFYMGHDSFVINKDGITHKFPAYLPDDPNCCPTGGDCIINYKYVSDGIIKTTHKHIPPTGQKGFDVLIKSAVGLPKMDTFSKTDCFIELYVDGNFLGKTKTIKNDNSPYFSEKFSARVYKGGKIEFDLLDEDVSGNRIIGKVIIIEPLSGSYPIQREDSKGNIISEGELIVEFKK